MHLQGAHGDSATAAAEQLMAEEAHEAAQAAAKKAKKQKAKARKQQACSDATSSSQPLASPTGSSLQPQQDPDPKATLLQSSPSKSGGEDFLRDQAPNPFQSDMQHRTAQDSAVPVQPVHTALGEQKSTSHRSASGVPAASAAAVDAFPGAHATFLDQLFCCPITKVLPPRPSPP